MYATIPVTVSPAPSMQSFVKSIINSFEIRRKKIVHVSPFIRLKFTYLSITYNHTLIVSLLCKCSSGSIE